jgi:hypothetical protein
MKELRKLFEEHKRKYGIPEHETLIFKWLQSPEAWRRTRGRPFERINILNKPIGVFFPLLDSRIKVATEKYHLWWDVEVLFVINKNKVGEHRTELEMTVILLIVFLMQGD